MNRLLMLALLVLSMHQLDGQSMEDRITTFLMFEGNAEEAMNFYVSLFDNSEITNITRYDVGREDSAMVATFTIHGKKMMCFDSPIEHPFTFTPSMSLYVNCESEEEIERLYNSLSDGGEVLMQLDSYPFSPKYGWVNDRFGVSWQLNLHREN